MHELTVVFDLFRLVLDHIDGVDMKTVGAYEAKTHLPQLLEEVSRGERVTITKHGVPVAILLAADSTTKRSAKDAIAELRGFRKAHKIDGLSIRDLIDEGRA